MINTTRHHPEAKTPKCNVEKQSSKAESPLRILHLENDPDDATLVQMNLEAGEIACTITRVQNHEDFVAALERGGIDLILCDYSGPGFDGTLAAKIAHTQCPNIPLILVSGMLGEELAVDLFKSGAADCIPKEYLSRLAPSVRRAMRDVTRRERCVLLEPQNFEVQKMDMLGQFSADMAHDFNNILSVIMSYSDLLMLDPCLDDRVRKHAEEIRLASKRAAGLTGQLLMSDRKQTVQPGGPNLNDVTQELNQMLRQLIDESNEMVPSQEHSRPMPAMCS